MKAKSKIVASVIIICMLAICAICLVACKDNCSHVWDEGTITKEATCTEFGIKEYKCTKCGATHTDGIYSLGHDWQAHAIDLSRFESCCSDTLMAEKCSKCGEIRIVSAPNLACDIDYSDATENKFTDENGVEHTVSTVACPNCELSTSTESWEKEINSCESETHYIRRFFYGEELIMEYSEESTKVEHDDLKRTYDLVGERCEEGIKVSETCSVCGYNSIYTYASGHFGEDFTINLSERNACEGTITGSRCGACGETIYMDVKDENISCRFDGEATSEEVVDESGITHTVMQEICSVCGLKFVRDSWDDVESACVTNERMKISIYEGTPSSILILESISTYVNDNHQYKEDVQMNGEGCDDGYVINRTCSVCGKTDSFEGSGHRYESRTIGLEVSGLCGGYVEEEYCTICSIVSRANIYQEACNWENKGVDENGYTVLTCLECGATRLEKIEKTPIDDKCNVRFDTTYIYSLDGKEVFRTQYSYTQSDHHFNYEFTMFGESCEEGYSVLVTCDNCDYRKKTTDYKHSMYTQFTLQDEHPYCNYHSLSISKCPCEQNVELQFDRLSFSYNETTQVYSCESCDLTITDKVEITEEGCIISEKNTISVKWAEDELYGLVVENNINNHSYSNVKATNKNGETVVTATCDSCSKQIESEINEAVIENHEGEYYYDYTFTPTETATYTIISLSDEDTQVYLYEMKNGTMVEVTNDDDSGGNNQFKLSFVLEAGKTYIYRISLFNQASEKTISYMLTTSMSNSSCTHENAVAFTKLLEGSLICEDGVLNGHVCVQCGSVISCYKTDTHQTVEVEVVSLEDYGACYGKFVFVSCACGLEGDFEFYSCAFETYNEYVDDQGRVIHEEINRCSSCGLRYTHSYYIVEDKANCRTIAYNTVIINVGDTPVVNREYTAVEEVHDYKITTKFLGVSGSCKDGVEITKTCKICGEEESETFYDHERYEVERINHADYGSVCGGFSVVEKCACGEFTEVELNDNCLCELEAEYAEPWIDDVIKGSNVTIDGHYYYNNYATIYTCTATEPTACAYKIRSAEYWSKIDGECYAAKYEVWQFGYNEETGEYKYQVGPYEVERRVYHGYTDSSTENCTKYDCSDCESFYYENNYYDQQERLIKFEKEISNTIADGNNKYSKLIEEYTYDTDGDEILTKSYEKTINSNNEERVKEYVFSDFEGTFGEGGYKEVTNILDFNGETSTEESAYSYYKDNAYIIYCYTTNGDYWRHMDCTYTFEDGCSVTSVYTDSDGLNESYTENVCKFGPNHLIKEPTCTQEGLRGSICIVCGKLAQEEILLPLDHAWVSGTNDMHFCSRCGYENATGESGDIVMEDLTESQGNGENYVVGYYMETPIEFSKYVSLVLADGTEVIVDGVEFTTIDGLTAFAFSKASIEAYATENSYTDYLVKFVIVPSGADSSTNYAITLANKTQNITLITGSVSFMEYIAKGETKTYTITPTENLTWTFMSVSDGDTIAELCDSTDKILVSNDDGEDSGRNYKIVYTLVAGETYTLKVKWYDSDDVGYLELVFNCETNVEKA